LLAAARQVAALLHERTGTITAIDSPRTIAVHQQYGRGRLAHDCAGDAANDSAANTRSGVGGHDDHVRDSSCWSRKATSDSLGIVLDEYYLRGPAEMRVLIADEPAIFGTGCAVCCSEMKGAVEARS
jgi:hypothetical protein